MKTKQILLGAIASLVLYGTNASAQISYNNGDMLAGFRTAGSSTEIIVDLGSIANFQNPAYSANFTGVAAAITSTFGSTAGVYWSVFGANDTTTTYNPAVTQTDANTVWNTLAEATAGIQNAAPHVAGNSLSQQLAVGVIGSIGNIAASSIPGVVSLSAGIAAVNISLGGYSASMADPYNGNLAGTWSYNMENLGAGISDLYQSNPGNHYTQKALALGSFTLSPTGAFSFSVPEPSTYAMMATGAFSLLAFGRFRRNNK